MKKATFQSCFKVLMSVLCLLLHIFHSRWGFCFRNASFYWASGKFW